MRLLSHRVGIVSAFRIRYYTAIFKSDIVIDWMRLPAGTDNNRLNVSIFHLTHFTITARFGCPRSHDIHPSQETLLEAWLPFPLVVELSHPSLERSIATNSIGGYSDRGTEAASIRVLDST